MDTKKIVQEASKILLKIGAVTFRFDPPYTYTSGIKSPVYTDNRLIISYPIERNKIIDLYVNIIKKEIGLENVDYISATASAALPHGSWVADRLNLPMVFVRPSTKSYGKGNKVEGCLKRGSKVVIVEDLISTATSVVNNVQAIRELGGKVKYCIATTSYETDVSIKNLKENKIKLITLTTGKLIVEEAKRQGLINQKEKEMVDIWFNDPVNWGKKMGF